jgi:NAD(P)-dependent dehydrogenase (short-subunit alcohol dehydrogenase family)
VAERRGRAGWVSALPPAANDEKELLVATPLSGKIALVFGAGRGLGAATAIACARNGMRIGLVSRTAADLEETASAVRAAGGDARAIVGDARDEASVEAAFMAMDAWGGASLVVNTVGEALIKPLAESTLADWRRLIDSNLTSCFLISRAAMPRLTARGGGRLIHLSSRAAVFTSPAIPIYAAAKAGVIGLVKSLAQQGKPHGVSVNVLCPSPMDTPMRWSATPDFDRARVLPPEAVADLIVLLAAHPEMTLEDGVLSSAVAY